MDAPVARTFPLASLSEMEMYGVHAAQVSWRGRSCVRLTGSAALTDAAHALAILADSELRDGVIEAEIAGAPRKDAPADMRGFVGIAFHVQPAPVQKADPPVLKGWRHHT